MKRGNQSSSVEEEKRNKEVIKINDRLERIKQESREAMRIAMRDYKFRTEKRNKEILEAFLQSQHDNVEAEKN